MTRPFLPAAARLVLPAAALLAAIAAWLSQSTLAVGGLDGARIGLLPLSPVAISTAVLAGAAVVGLSRAGASLAPVWLLIVVVLPWLPWPVPTAFLIWAGSIRWLIWTAVVLIMLATTTSRPSWRRVLHRLRALVSDRPSLAAGACAFVIFACAAWQVSPSVPGGDEPHYLVITQSLLLDGDLKIENNHRRGDYQAYYAGALAPHYIRRGANGEIYSIHAPGLSAVVLPAFAVGGYRAVVLLLLVIASCGSALAWHLAWLASGRVDAAWFGWAAVTLAATTIFHSFTVYPDGPGSVIALTGVWAFVRAEEERRTGESRLLPWLLHGAALALLPWLHSRFSLLAGCIGALVLLRLSATKNPAGKAVAFLSVPAVSAVLWLNFFRAVYGVADPSAPYGSVREFSLGFIPGGLAGLLFDQRFGLVANAPALIVGLAGLLMMRTISRRAPSAPDSGGLADRRLALELLFVMVPYLLTATSYAMWWAGWSAPARFANPAVLILAIPCAVAWSRMQNRGSRAVAAGFLAFSAFLSCVLVVTDGGRLAYNTRETTALWLGWASTLAPLADGIPVWFRGQEGAFAIDIGVWAVSIALAWWCARALASTASLVDRGRLLTAIAAVHIVAAMVAVTLVWRIHSAGRLLAAPAALAVLRSLATEPRALAVQVMPPRTLAAGRLLEMLPLEPAVLSAAGGRGRIDPTVAVLPAIPAGRYRVRVILQDGGGSGGMMMFGIGQDQFALRSVAVTWPAPPIEIAFPVDVRALIVRGDEDVRRAIRRVIVEPLDIVPARARLTNLVARRAVRYDDASVFFLDDRSFPEPEGFWIGGSRQSTFVVQPDAPRPSVDLHLRNAPIENRLTIASGQWQEVLTLAPGEERVVQIPLAPGQGAVLVSATTTAGFRPSASTPGSRDERFLGVWVKPGV
jgi:hypothetical protein